MSLFTSTLLPDYYANTNREHAKDLMSQVLELALFRLLDSQQSSSSLISVRATWWLIMKQRTCIKTPNASILCSGHCSTACNVRSPHSQRRSAEDTPYRCSRCIRNVEEIDMYLLPTESMFSFDYFVHINREIEDERLAKYFTKAHISCVNCVDHSEPDEITYSTVKKTLDRVPLTITEACGQGCVCTDNCMNRIKCACWRKT